MEKKAQDRLIDKMEAGANKAKAFCECSEMIKGIIDDIANEKELADDMYRVVLIATQLPEPPLNYPEILEEVDNRAKQYHLLMKTSEELLKNEFLINYFKSDVEYIYRQHQLLYIYYSGMKSTLYLGK